MRKRILLLLALPVICVRVLNAADAPRAVFQEANAAYGSSDYEIALSSYEALITLGISDPGLYYNAADCYYRLNRLGKAVANYERALRLSPRDEDARFNLRLIRSVMKEPDRGILYDIATALTLNTLTVFCSFMFFLLFAGLITSLFVRNAVLADANIALACVFLAILGWWYANYSLNVRQVCAVVITRNAEVRSGPGTDFAAQFTVPDGKEVRVLARNGDWCAVAVMLYEPGKSLLKGWIRSDSIEKIQAAPVLH